MDLASFALPLSEGEVAERRKAQTLWQLAGEDVSRLAAPPSAAIEVKQKSLTLRGHTAETVFQADEGGRIVGLRVSPARALAGKGRDLLLRITVSEVRREFGLSKLWIG